MEDVLIVFLMLARISHAFFPVADTSCSALQNTSVCSVSAGGSVYIQVKVSGSSHKLRCMKQLQSRAINVFTVKKGKVDIAEALRNRTQFFVNNSTLKITNVDTTDSGQYTIEDFNSDGILLSSTSVKLEVNEHGTFLFIVKCASLVVVGLLIVLVVSCCVYRRWRRRQQRGAELKASRINNKEEFWING
ncbi:uncharacterized protein si:zfos-741a10.3 [Thalassophryne amazonica]|uniref:uncharacterized protein si:zfos-741a10.3 n=1 Tax=Thalassophryne amazonica TaxID=390379 RepID=UPI001471E465|nr:uncharacterized protein si:zfos-741a10.3 [Thalassophryne amazonica]